MAFLWEWLRCDMLVTGNRFAFMAVVGRLEDMIASCRAYSEA